MEKRLYRQGYLSQAAPQHGKGSMEAISGAAEHSHKLSLEQIRLIQARAYNFWNRKALASANLTYPHSVRAV